MIVFHRFVSRPYLDTMCFRCFGCLNHERLGVLLRSHMLLLTVLPLLLHMVAVVIVIVFRLPISSSGTAWRDLKKHHVRAYNKAFPNYLTVDDIGQALERLNIR